MAGDTPVKMQIYSSTPTKVTPYWKDKYERDAKRYWDIFYKKHQDKFFKDRHYLDKEWGSYFSDRQLTVLEIGCGAGNTVFPLLAKYPNIFVHACDFSPRAVSLVKAHKEFTENQVNAFVCNLTVDDLSKSISPSSVDIVTMVFVLSAVAPEKMPLVLHNIKKVLKPNGHVLLRDYANGDLAQERLISKDQKISENFYVRGDGTRAFYFSENFLTSLFKRNGFSAKEVGVCYKEVENRSKVIVMNRRWIQAVFSMDLYDASEFTNEVGLLVQQSGNHGLNVEKALKVPANQIEFDISESIAMEMFGMSPSIDEIIEINLRNYNFRIKGLTGEHQHTCRSTGLMLWESACLMCQVLADNPLIVSGKKMLELGCGCAGICSMVAVRSAELVVATDGDITAFDLLRQNVASNVLPVHSKKIVTELLEWGDKDHLRTVRDLSHDEGFQVIIGTDVTYNAESISPLFKTARGLIAFDQGNGELEPCLILCHVLRRVDEPSILTAASRFGFKLVDSWSVGSEDDQNSDGGIISSWFSHGINKEDFQNTALNILYFNVNSP
ncbi:hypothetical protein QJS04_geneDACA000803 [Acorus gramineus]|uniref:Methyltransferase type 12 domain-containing protein n=1 Tax=Acorus gramineus TaxID=55184 RepID=A0AAV9BET2_ACOGR|nr:hypothetical protein QJS04_geneDACA000803 [Acorus gramineus]